MVEWCTLNELLGLSMWAIVKITSHKNLYYAYKDGTLSCCCICFLQVKPRWYLSDHITNIENDPRHSLIFHDGVNNVPAVCLLVGLLEFALNNDDAIVAFRSEQCLLVLWRTPTTTFSDNECKDWFDCWVTIVILLLFCICKGSVKKYL